MKNTFVDKRVLVTGGAGFIGSHLVDQLIALGAQVTVVDNLITGNLNNLSQNLNSIKFIEADVVTWAQEKLHASRFESPQYDYIFHLASPAAPKGYMEHPVETYMVNALGTHYLAQLAINTKATLLFTSTSEAYGDPLEHPQTETYWGNVNPIGPRACYDESKRFGEMVMMTQIKNYGLDGRIVRIFNTYGPRMNPVDGRIFPELISQALKNQPMTVHGTGLQTRSFCYVSDLVEFLLRAMVTTKAQGEVINIGTPQEFSIIEIAQKIKHLTQSTSEIIFVERPVDDPNRRKPDITKAISILNYEPTVSLDEGLLKTIAYFKTL